MKLNSLFSIVIASAAMMPFMTSCDTTPDYEGGFGGSFGGPGGMGGMFPGGMGGGSSSNDGTPPSIDNVIYSWDGKKASDAANDIPGQDSDLYHEANNFTKKVEVTFAGNSATVSPANDSEILCHVSDAYVTIDMATNAVSGVEIVLKGSSDNGGIKIYGTKKFKLTLNGLNLTSTTGPAINNQCKKRMFLHVADGTENSLADAPIYYGDPYYLDPSQEEDQKGCLFSEGSIILSGTGTLAVTGQCKHAVATDNMFTMRPGSNLIIQGAAKNGLHVKGDNDTAIKILGGYIYAKISSQAGKAIKADLNVEIAGGELDLNTTGTAIYDSDERDTSSASGIKTDANIIITDGTISTKSTGSGGKGLSADGQILISGGETTVATCGNRFTYSGNHSSPKGVKAKGNISISGGSLNIAVTGKAESAEGLESKSTLSISGGNVNVYAYDDAINASSAIEISGGNVVAYSCNNDGIDSNGSLTISGGTVNASGTSAPDSGIDADFTNWFKINGGTVFAVGGTLQSLPSSESEQYCVSYSGLTASKGATVKLLDSSSKTLAEYTLPRSLSSGNLFFSTPDLKANAKYTITLGDQTLTTFSPSSKITSL